MPPSRTLSVGRDVHQASLAVASAAKASGAEVVSLGTIGTRQGDLDPLIRRLPSQSPPRVFVSEAGPCGDWLSRYVTKKSPVCWVVAPSLLPKQAGARGNTTRRDASTLARLMRSGDLPPVDVPAVADAASRDLGRARDEALPDLQAATWRRNAFLRRQAMRSTGRAPWRPAPRRWRSAVGGPPPAPQLVLQAYGPAVTDHPARLARLEPALPDQVQTWRLAPVVDALQGLRGGQCTGAVTTGAERGARTRVEHPRQRMRYLGLTPAD